MHFTATYNMTRLQKSIFYYERSQLAQYTEVQQQYMLRRSWYELFMHGWIVSNGFKELRRKSMSNYEERLVLNGSKIKRRIAIEGLWYAVDDDYPAASSIGRHTDTLGWTIESDVKWNHDSGQDAWQILAVLVLCAEGEILEENKDDGPGRTGGGTEQSGDSSFPVGMAPNEEDEALRIKELSHSSRGRFLCPTCEKSFDSGCASCPDFKCSICRGTL